MPDELPDELPDNVPQWYGKPFRKVDGNPEQCGFRPVVMAEQTEMEPSFFLFQIDTFRHALLHRLVQFGDFQTGDAPFPVSERELYTHKSGIVRCRLVEIVKILRWREIDQGTVISVLMPKIQGEEFYLSENHDASRWRQYPPFLSRCSSSDV